MTLHNSGRGGKREGSGRPKKDNKPRTIRVTDEEYEKVKEYIELLKENDYTEKMKEIKTENLGDEEAAHSYADILLCELIERIGFNEVVKVYESIEKWYA